MSSNSRRRFCYIHLAKAGGTTLQWIFRNNTPYYVSLSPRKRWAVSNKECILSANELKFLLKFFPFCQGLGGHHLREYSNLSDLSDGFDYITFFREPISRYLSHYYYLKNTRNEGGTIDDWLANDRYHNYCVNRFSQNGCLKEAKKRLENSFKFVGLLEEFDESLVLLRHFLNRDEWVMNYERRNAGINKPREYDKVIWKRAEEANRLDIELYDWVKNDLYPRYKDLADLDLALELENFRRVNQTFRFSKLKQFLAKLIKFSYLRNLEYVGFLLHGAK